ncbi:C-terminal processing protease CtpA/Prc, contains a PDZ domain [Chitinophaga sp. YR627]|uniref:S41 family peptidase n=1 Tax=Chitinophaga sp. YR627 TaxID=1881041 RepID=UPI0008F26061|nr:S41 family peptidase [Chitinophaga sp. YR627]SFN44339.1 C-terminal processing protease CtpA/Prc, contains a PDZ domain [Chitinophaga sp. YR627]
MYRKPLTALTLSLLLIACKKDDVVKPAVPTGPVTRQEINTWILDSMRYFYLWNNGLPALADSQHAATAFFAGLKDKADRFSVIYQQDDPSSFPKYMLYAFGITFNVISYPAAPGGAIGVTGLVVPGSGAAILGIKRGDYFTAINGTTLTTTNAASLSQEILNSGNAVLNMATINGNTVQKGEDIPLTARTIREQPIYKQSIQHVNGKTVAYLFYNAFDDYYNLNVLNAFKQFKDAGATELILDLRYNAGGSVTGAALLNALIAPGINENSVFAKYGGNDNMGQRTVSYKSALSVPESGSPITFSGLTAGRLALQRVFILTGPQTASAAELTINTLKSYMQVVQIGLGTLGKDKAAVIITDMRSPQRIPYTMLPLTYNLANAKGEGGYVNGITPDYRIDELSVLPLSPVGDAEDPLIAKAVSIISGGGRERAYPETVVQRYFDAQATIADRNVLKIPTALR